jgi:hypothetical protein
MGDEIELLAGAGLAREQHRAVDAGHARQQREDLARAGRGADHPGVDALGPALDPLGFGLADEDLDRAEAHPAAAREGGVVDANSARPGAVEAAEIAHAQAFGRGLDLGVHARDAGAGDHQRGARGRADQHSLGDGAGLRASLVSPAQVRDRARRRRSGSLSDRARVEVRRHGAILSGRPGRGVANPTSRKGRRARLVAPPQRRCASATEPATKRVYLPCFKG